MCLFAKSVCGHWSVPISMACLYFLLLRVLRQSESVRVSISAASVEDHSIISHRQESHTAKWLLHPCSHLYPPLNPPFFSPSLQVSPSFPLLLDEQWELTHIHKHTPPPPLEMCRQMLTNVLLVSVGVSFQMNLYTSAPELTSIGFNSFNSHDICLLAYLLSKQALAQLASRETVTPAFGSVSQK